MNVSHRHTLDALPVAPKSASEGPAPQTLATFNNHVFFFAQINDDRCLALTQELRTLDANLRAERLNRDLPDDFPSIPIYLHIQSGGGSLYSAFHAMDEIKALSQKTPIISIARGICASAATLLAMACTKRYIAPSGMMLIHQFSTFMIGTHEEFKDEMKLQEKLIEKLVSFYSTNSKVSADEIREMLKRDTWMDANEALSQGFVDGIWQGN